MNQKILFSALLLLLFCNLFAGYVLATEARGDILTVSFLDVGQGDSIFIQAPNGNQVLIDGGPSKAVLRSLAAVLPFYDRSINLLLVSNPDKDHIGGFIDVLDRFKVSMIVEPGTKSTTAAYAALTEAIKRELLESRFVRAQDAIVLDSDRGIVLEILFPDRDVSRLAINDGSIVARLSYGSICFLLTGDATKGVERYLAQRFPDKVSCQVLKVAHHGSDTSSPEEFVAAVAPEYAVISAGKANRYGHPHQETLKTLAQYGVEILRTDSLGTVEFKTDGKRIWRND